MDELEGDVRDTGSEDDLVLKGVRIRIEEKQRSVLPALGFFAVYVAATAAHLLLAAASRGKNKRRPPASALPHYNFRIDPALCQGKVEVGALELCRVFLVDDAQYPAWLVLVPQRNGLKEVIDLDSAGQQQLWHEVAATMRVLQRVFKPDKLNLSAVGNMVPQLHVHITGRMKGDAAWPNVHLGAGSAVAHDHRELQDKVARIVAALKEEDIVLTYDNDEP